MSARWPQPDFVAAPARRPMIAWAWIAAAGLVAATTANDWLAARRALDLQRERLALARRHAPAAPAARAAGSEATPSGAEAIRAARRVADRIAHPWDRLLANLEAETPDGLQWLAFDHDADDAAVRLEGAAADIPGVLTFVDNLSGRPGWSDVALGRLRAVDAREAAASNTPWQFELRAAVDARRLAATRRGEVD